MYKCVGARKMGIKLLNINDICLQGDDTVWFGRCGFVEEFAASIFRMEAIKCSFFSWFRNS